MRTKPTLDLADAEIIAAACREAADKMGLKVSIAVVDDSGGLVLLLRLDGARGFSVDIATRKARTAAALGVPTRILEERLGGRPLPLSDMMILPGGVPVISEGAAAGAVGVSGASAEDDDKIADAGVRALQAGPAA